MEQRAYLVLVRIFFSYTASIAVMFGLNQTLELDGLASFYLDEFGMIFLFLQVSILFFGLILLGLLFLHKGLQRCQVCCWFI